MNFKQKLSYFITINLGIILIAIGFSFFLEPNNIVAGGVTGLALIIHDFIPKLEISLAVLILNTILLIISLFALGKKYFIKTVYGSLAYPVYIFIFSKIISYFNIAISEDIFLCSIFGAVFVGLGLGLVLKLEATTGGIDILQALLYKYKHVNYSKSGYIFDGLIILGGMQIFGLDKGLYAILHLFLCGQLYDAVIFNGFNKRAVYIISDNFEEIKQIIIKDLERGATLIPSLGGFTNKNKFMIMSIMTTKEYSYLRNKVKKIDEGAFMIACKAEEIHGFGFSIKDDTKSKVFF